VVLLVSVHVIAVHGLLVLVYKTACVIRYSFTQILPQLLGPLPSSRVKVILSARPNKACVDLALREHGAQVLYLVWTFSVINIPMMG